MAIIDLIPDDGADPNTPSGPAPNAPDPTTPGPSGPAPNTPDPTTTDPLYTGIEDLYKKYLKRTPNRQEVTGHMPNPGGIAGVEQTILSSPEYAALSGGTGQTPPSTTNYSDYDASDPWHWFKQFISGLAPTSASLKGLESTLAKYGVKVLTNARGLSGKVQLPDGTIVDVIQGVEAGGQAWQWLTGDGGGSGGSGGSVGTVSGLPANLVGSQYNDEYTRQMEELINSRLQQLTSGYQNSQVDQYGNLLQGRIDSLQNPSPELQNLLDSLNKRIASLGQEDDYTRQLRERNESLKGTTAELQKLIDFANKRATDLQGPQYTQAQREIYRTQALDPIETDRQAARQRVMADLSTRGLDLNSGIAQSALNQVDRAYDGLRAQSQGSLAAAEVDSYESRQQEAQLILEQLAQIPELRADQALAVMQQLSAYVNGREKESLTLQGTVSDIGENRQNQSVAYANELAELSNWSKQQEESRANQAISLSGVLADLGPARLQLALQALGQGGSSPESVSSALNAIMGQYNNQQGIGIQNSASNSYALGQTLGYLFSPSQG